MILYHYTCHEHLPAILEQGLTRGEVPMSASYCLNAVWLTSDIAAGGHGLSDGRLLTKAECQIIGAAFGKAMFPDKRAIRITVDADSAKLDRWVDWAPPRLDPKWLHTLNKGGGGLKKARTWFLHWDSIPPSKFLSVEVLRGHGVREAA